MASEVLHKYRYYYYCRHHRHHQHHHHSNVIVVVVTSWSSLLRFGVNYYRRTVDGLICIFSSLNTRSLQAQEPTAYYVILLTTDVSNDGWYVEILLWNIMEPITVYCIRKKKDSDTDVVALAPTANLWLSKKRSGSSICSTERLRFYKATRDYKKKKRKVWVGETSFQSYSIVCSMAA